MRSHEIALVSEHRRAPYAISFMAFAIVRPNTNKNTSLVIATACSNRLIGLGMAPVTPHVFRTARPVNRSGEQHSRTNLWRLIDPMAQCFAALLAGGKRRSLRTPYRRALIRRPHCGPQPLRSVLGYFRSN